MTTEEEIEKYLFKSKCPIPENKRNCNPSCKYSNKDRTTTICNDIYHMKLKGLAAVKKKYPHLFPNRFKFDEDI
jgi:hypothetical protein